MRADLETMPGKPPVIDELDDPEIPEIIEAELVEDASESYVDDSNAALDESVAYRHHVEPPPLPEEVADEEPELSETSEDEHPLDAEYAVVPAEEFEIYEEPASFITRMWRKFCSAVEWMFGGVTLVIGLAVLSSIPVLNFLSLGYLLQCSGNVARTGRLRDGFIGVRKVAVLASMVIGTWLVFWPARIASGMWKDAELIAPGSGAAQGWWLATLIFTELTILHVIWALLRGGKLRHFFWPAPVKFFRWVVRDADYGAIRDNVIGFVRGLRLPHYFKLGAQGFFAALAWLIVPVGILMLATQLPPGGALVLSLPGALLLMIVVLYLPFLQARFALTGNVRAMFELRNVRELFKHAPVAFWTALFVTLLFSIPLYLAKIELTPRELTWFPALFFVTFMFPARLLTGWAMGRALRRPQPRHAVFRWMGRLAALPVVGMYVLIVYLTQFLSWHGALSLLEQHAFLVPAPLFGI